MAWQWDLAWWCLAYAQRLPNAALRVVLYCPGTFGVIGLVRVDVDVDVYVYICMLYSNAM